MQNHGKRIKKIDTGKVKRSVLLALGLLMLGSALIPGWDWGERALNAQDSNLIVTPIPGQGVANEITHPHTQDAVHGFTKILGSALISNFLRYDMHIAPAGSENWQWVMTDYRIVRNGVLHTLDTTQYPDGFYDLRLRALNSTGDYSESYIRNLEVRNANPPTPTPVINAAGERVFIISAPTPTPTPTPTSINESRVEGGQGFYAPQSGDTLAGYANIVATVNGFPSNPFERYELFISPAGLEEWAWLFTDDQQFWQEGIYLLNTRLFPDGVYDMRLRIVYRDANFDQRFLRNLRFANQPAVTGDTQPGSAQTGIVRHGDQGNGILTPRTGQVVNGRVEFRGSAADPEFLRWELYWSPAGAEQWAFATSGDRPVYTGQFATLDLSLMPPGAYDFRLRVVQRDHNYDEHFLRNVQIIAPTPTPIRILSVTPIETQ